MSVYEGVNIDGDSLRNEIRKAGLSQQYVGKTMGFSANYISNCIANEVMPKSVAKNIAQLFGISYDSFVLSDKEYNRFFHEKADRIVGVDYSILSKVIRQALYDTMKDIVETSLEGTISKAIKNVFE